MATAAAAATASAPIRFARTKHGFGRIVAARSELNSKTTQLIAVSHKSPARCIPLPSSAVAQQGAAVCVLGNYGGGLLGGDVLEYDIKVERDATLGLITQGSNRIYKQRVGIVDPSRTTLHATVEKGGCLVLAPDPVSVFQNSNYQQYQEISLEHADADFCVLDWFSAGRLAQGERWQQERLAAQTKILINGKLVLVDSTLLDPSSMDWSGGRLFNAYATVMLYGPKVQDVVQNFRIVQEDLVGKQTRIREREDRPSDASIPLNLSGQVVVGVSRCSIPGSPHDLHVARFVAQNNEDLHRIFHRCLQPLPLGLEVYKDRIHASQSAIVSNAQDLTVKKKQLSSARELPPIRRSNSSKAYWSASILADSALPVGSFAHSAGLEAAQQLGFPEVAHYVRVSTRSTVQLTAPLVRCSHAWVTQKGNTDNLLVLQDYAQALLVSNEPACRASLDQGQALLRVAKQWLREDPSKLQVVKALSNSPENHLATVWGVVTALLDLTPDEAVQLLAFCVARDVVSAAVRLNLVGPLASVQVLAAAQEAAEGAIAGGHPLVKVEDVVTYLDTVSAASAPVVDAIQPCHDVLATRLFRT